MVAKPFRAISSTANKTRHKLTKQPERTVKVITAFYNLLCENFNKPTCYNLLFYFFSL